MLVDWPRCISIAERCTDEMDGLIAGVQQERGPFSRDDRGQNAQGQGSPRLEARRGAEEDPQRDDDQPAE